jgi:HlyD family secretion protein
MPTVTQKIKNVWESFSGWIREHKKTSIALGIVLVLIIYFIATRGSAPANVVTDTVVRRELRSTVLATGDVTSTTDLDLSFASSGTVSGVKVKVGDKVYKGDVLATLSNQSQYGAVTQAQGSVKSAQAALDKLIEGATNEEVAVAQTALSSAQVSLSNTKLQQATLVSNARTAVLNAGLQIKPAPGSSSTPTYTPTLSGTYTGTDQGQYTITTHGGSGAYFTYSGLDSGTALSNVSTAVPLGTHGLFLTFPTGFSTMSDTQWVVTIPNTESPSYLTAQNAYNNAVDTQTSAIASAQASVDTAQANLNLKKASARGADVEAAQANVLSAQGQLQTAQAAYNNTIITAPADGTITAVDIKVGELASAQKEVLILQDVSHLYLEANINEADISSVVLGQPVEVTFDAFGPDKKYAATISHIDPASTVVSGVVNYKIEAEIQGDVTGVLPGMTANMTIVTKDKAAVLVVPTRAILDGKNGKVVRVITDAKKKTYSETPVTLGIQGDDGTEILSGLSEGQTIVVLSSATGATAAK